MDVLPHVVIVLARCSRSRQAYGMRFEETLPDRWIIDWAFPIGESAARREGYTHSLIQGKFQRTASFPGCPHCHAPTYFLCGCGKVGCYDGDSEYVTCPWCFSTGKLKTGTGPTRLDAGETPE